MDYNRSVVQACKDLVNHTINSFGSLDIICHPWAPISPDLPSWVLQSSRHAFASDCDGRRINADSLVGSSTRPIYNAGGKDRPAKALFSDRGAGFNLQVAGFQLDRITVVLEPASDGIIPSEWMELGTRIAEDREDSEFSVNNMRA